MANEIICLKNDGKVKLVKDQYELNKLNPDEYSSYWFPVDDEGLIYKELDPHSKYAHPIKKVVVEYSLVLYSDYHPCWDDDMGDEFYDMGIYNSKKVIKVEFNDVIDFIKFIQSINNLAAFNLQFSLNGYANGYYEVSRPIVCIGGFIMQYTGFGDTEPREFKLKKKHRKLTKDVMVESGCFMLPTLLAALDEFFEYPFAELSNDRYIRQDKIFINKKMTSWDTQRHDKWLQSFHLLVRGVFTFINEGVVRLLERIDETIASKVTLCEYNLMVSEDILPEEPVSVDMIYDYDQFFDMYDAHAYVSNSIHEVVEFVLESLSIINTASMIRDLNPTTNMLWDKSVLEIKLHCDVGFSKAEVKYRVYDFDVTDSNANEVFNNFMTTFLYEINKPF